MNQIWPTKLALKISKSPSLIWVRSGLPAKEETTLCCSATSLILRWFRKKRGRIIGIVTGGIGAGGLIMPTVVGGLLIPVLGWRITFLIIGFLPILLLVPLALFIIRERPEDIGLLPDNAKKQPLRIENIQSNITTEIGLTVR